MWEVGKDNQFDNGFEKSNVARFVKTTVAVKNGMIIAALFRAVSNPFQQLLGMGQQI